MTDGPHGIGPRLGKATYFPTGSARTASWDAALWEAFGRAMAAECALKGCHLWLAPGVNLVRVGLGGRTFEYHSEDPLLSGASGASVVRGAQASGAVAACVKHFACNNQETARCTLDAIVDERTLHELYLPAFEQCVRAGALVVMACYNRVNGHYGCAHRGLLREVLLGQWGFEGFVVSDWFATQFVEDPAVCVRAGLSLEMPAPDRYHPSTLLAMLGDGRVALGELEENVRRLLRVMMKLGLFDGREGEPVAVPEGESLDLLYCPLAHRELARRMALESMVLLKNEKATLPLRAGQLSKLCVAGPNADRAMGMGGGSSSVDPPYEVTPLQGISRYCQDHAISLTPNPKEADAVILVLGTGHDRATGETEGKDRETLCIAEEQVEMVREMVGCNERVVVVLVNGGPLCLAPWIEWVPAVVEAWFGGMEVGNALAGVLFGEESPSGRLPFTFPLTPDLPPKRAFPGLGKDNNLTVYYDEGLHLQYRSPEYSFLFPFGHGLSYTSFEYQELKVVEKDGSALVSCLLRNVGEREGKEVVQFYVQCVDGTSKVVRAAKELKGFKKVHLGAGEEKEVVLELKRGEVVRYYDVLSHAWREDDEGAIFNVLIGSSSEDIRLKGRLF
eukprot:TRINITY_DN2155_c0_g1_i1.p1 TRINITY_DN2155_c0_g1~~TRINITY_DN2155_c0_g1_i1.p1  ORF type:complete len:696 (-),score=162.51 TRINITY_DN2155_c0_g1_i1:62-1918(-)